MSTPIINNDYQTRLLFKQFVGVASSRLDSEFSVEKFTSIPNIFSKDIMIEEIPSTAPQPIGGFGGLETSGNWVPSTFDYNTNTFTESTFSGVGPNNGLTFSEVYPDANLKFYKRLSLVPVDNNSQGRVWGCFTDYSGSFVGIHNNKESVLEHCIPFKFDDINATYAPVVRYNLIFGTTLGAGTGTSNFKIGNLNASPLYWVMDAGTGYLQFYADKTDLEAVGVKSIKNNNIQDPDWAPTISCYVYNGKLGITNIDVSGQQQVGDLSGVLASIGGVDRMLLPDGSANILDLCGNDAIRTQYEYVRKNLFVGYPTHPILDAGDTVNHVLDPSYNDIKHELDVSGSTYLGGKLSQGTSFASGTNSVAFGGKNRAFSLDSFACGRDCSASGICSFVHGKQTQATGQGAHSEGNTTAAAGAYSHAEGQETLASDTGTHTEGLSTKAYGAYSHAEGMHSESHAQGSHATGHHTIIDTPYGTSIGKFNDTSENVLFVVGDGGNVAERHDAFIVYENGNTKVIHNLDVNGHTQLVDVSATNLDLSGTLDVVGQSNFNNINAKTTINNKETYLLVKSELSGPITPMVVNNTPIVDYFNVAYFKNGIAETKNVAAYFVFTNNRSISENKQCIHFIAGANRNENGDISGGYIKVLSNYVDIASNAYVALTEIAIATNAPYTNLILGFSTNAVGSQISDCELRMYKNTYGLQEDTGPSWIMGKNVPVTNGLFNNKLISPEDYPGTLWSKIIEIHIDPLTCPNAYSTLNETFLGDVDICGNFNMSGTGTIGNLVLGDLEVTGNTLLRGTLDVCGNTTLENTTVNENLTVAKIIFTKDISAGNLIESKDISASNYIYSRDISASNYIYSNGYRGNSNRTNAPLILDASYNDFCSFNIKHQRGDISIGKKSEQTGWTIQSEDGIHMLTDSTRMNPISVTEKTLDMSDNDIINIRTLGVQDISVNELSGNNIYSHGSLLLDYSSVEITTASNSGNWYDIAFVGNETIGISDISKTYLGSSASAVIEIYVIEKLETDHTRLSNGFSYVKCNVELFREQSASIEVITGFNMAASKKIIQSLRIKYGRQGAKSGYPLPPEPRGLFQIKLSEEDMSGNNGGNEPTLSLYCRITDNNFISYQTASGFEYPETTWRMHLGTIVNDSPTYFYQGNASPGLSTNYHTYETFREVECVFNPNVGTLTSNGVAIEMNGRMYYINDKDSEFTSNCKFGEDVDFSNNILVRGNANINGTLSASQYVGGIYCDGSDISNVNRINCNYCDISYGLVVGDGHSGAALDISNTSLTRLKFRGYKMSSSPINTLVATVNTTIGTATSYNNKLYFTVNPENSPDVAFVVKTPNNDTAFVIGNTNNIECNVGLSLYRDTVVNVDAGLVTNSMGIMNDVGYNVDAAKMMDALVWKPNIPGSIDTKVLVNEMVSHIYNRQLTGSMSYGGIKPGNSSTETLGSSPNTYQYQKYVEAGGPIRHSYFGFNPTSNDGTSSSRPISSKSHFLRDTWITGLYMNTPWCDPSSNNAGTLFTWGVTPTASYVDIEIGYSNNYTQVYRIGNDPSANAMYFPSSTGYNTSSGGVRIDLEAKDWIYVEAGTNQATVIRFKYFMGSGGEIYILDEKDSTNYHHSEIDGYVTYVQHPRAI